MIGRRVKRGTARAQRSARWPWNTSVLLGGGLVLLIAGGSLVVPLLSPLDPLAQNLRATLQPPSGQHLLGSDQLGRDILARLVHGGRTTIGIGALTTLIGLGFGLMLGLVGGYYGGRIEALTMRSIDLLMALPDLLLALTVVAAMGFGTTSVIVAVGLASIPAIARVTHGTVKQIRELDYVASAAALGASNMRVVVRHLLPNIAGSVVAIASIRWSRNILLASGLSIVGVGVQPPAPEWGLMIAAGRLYIYTQPMLVLAPAGLIILISIGFTLLGEGIEELSDPLTRGSQA